MDVVIPSLVAVPTTKHLPKELINMVANALLPNLVVVLMDERIQGEKTLKDAKIYLKTSKVFSNI